jgi:membrane fusion protein (multidrug efflux system)
MNIKRWLVATGLVITVVVALGIIKFNQVQAMIAFAESFPEPSATVASDIATSSTHTPVTKVVGQVKAIKAITLSNEYPGLITAIHFQPGQLVEQGQLLIQQDISEESANLAAAEARLKLNTSTLKRLSELLKQERVSQDQVDQAEANLAIARAEIAGLKSVINKKTIKAPFAGQIGLTQYQVGQLLTAHSAITSLVGTEQKIWVDFMLPQTLPQLAIGATVDVNSLQTGLVENRLVQATVIARNASVSENSRQIQYRAELDNSDNHLSHNQVVSVIVPMAKLDVILVPSAAITRNHLGEFVFALIKDENNSYRAKSIKVTIGSRVGDQQIVTQGLSGGEVIATEGAFKLRDQLLVYTSNQMDDFPKGAK